MPDNDETIHDVGAADTAAMQQDKVDIDTSKESVHGYNKQNLLIIGAVLVLVVIGYFIFFSGTKTTPTATEFQGLEEGSGQKAGTINAPHIDAYGGVDLRAAVTPAPQPTPPPPPTPTVVVAPPIAEPPKTEPSVSTPPPVDQKATVTTADQIKQNKIKSSMILVGAQGSNQDAGKGDDKDKSTAQAPRTLRNNFDPTATSAIFSKITKAGTMSLLITQGKIMDAVLETPVNTNYPGPIRAIISKDVYSEMGSNVLIPKGSRLVGTVAGGYQAGQDRVTIIWNRLLLPSGFDIMMQDARGVDKLGQIGLVGEVDRQFFATIGSAVLLSAINVMVANQAQKRLNIAASQSSVVTDPTGNQTSTATTSPTQQATDQAVNNLGTTTQQWLKDNFAARPFIVIEQGSLVKVFANQDILFPEHFGSMSVLK